MEDLDKKQIEGLWRRLVITSKIQSFGSHGSELFEHCIAWTFVPITVINFLYPKAIPFVGSYWMPSIVGGFLFSSLWYVDQKHTGNYFLVKRIAHVAIAYILVINWLK